MKKVVVIGGGFVGSIVAQSLEKQFDVTLVDTKNYFEFTPAILRTIVEPKHIKRVQILHKHYLHKATIVSGRAIKFTKKQVHLKDGKKLNYDYLVIAVGSSYGSMIKQENVVLAARASTLRKTHAQLLKANNVVIIGGGLVGCELAAEIIEDFPKKKVTILHSRATLLQRNTKKAQKYAEQFFKKRKVKLVFEDRMIEVKKKEVLTKSGNSIPSDLTFLCVGIKPNSEVVKNSFPEKLNERGAIIVDKYLRVKDFKNVFAGGDITDVKEEKTAQNAEIHARLIVSNILKVEGDQMLESYVVKKRPMIISLGKWHGILQGETHTLTGLIPGLLKIIPEWKTMRSRR